jgi:hypothetical protein
VNPISSEFVTLFFGDGTLFFPYVSHAESPGFLFFLCDSSGFYNHSLKQGKRKESLFGCELCGMSKIPTHSFETKSYILKRINKNTFLILLNCFDSTFAYGGLSSPYS